MPVVLIGTKTDLVAERQVPYDTAQRHATELRVAYIECSAKFDNNVEQCFRYIMDKAILFRSSEWALI